MGRQGNRPLPYMDTSQALIGRAIPSRDQKKEKIVENLLYKIGEISVAQLFYRDPFFFGISGLPVKYR